MSDEWGPWIEHDGKDYPDAIGSRVFARSAVGNEGVVVSESPSEGGNCFLWGTLSGRWYPHRITSYRLRRPAALQTLIEIAANPAPMPEEVEA